MYKNKTIVAIILARGGSKSIPKKNIIDFCGKPLIAWTIEQTLQSKHIKEVYVSTEDKETVDVSQKFFSKNADSLFSASVLEDFCIWESINNELKSITFDYKNRGRRQDRKPYYLENGSIYIFKPEILEQYNNRLGGKIALYLMPLWKSYEIDSIEDIEICEYYMRNKILNKKFRRS